MEEAKNSIIVNNQKTDIVITSLVALQRTINFTVKEVVISTSKQKEIN